MSMEIDPHLPINKLAARVVSKSSEHGPEFKCGDKIVSSTKLPTKMWHGRKQDDLTGRKSGDFTVIGCALWMPKNHATSTNNTRWVVRCRCGNYEMMTTKAVKKNSPHNSCTGCRKMKAIKLRASNPNRNEPTT